MTASVGAVGRSNCVQDCSRTRGKAALLKDSSQSNVGRECGGGATAGAWQGRVVKAADDAVGGGVRGGRGQGTRDTVRHVYASQQAVVTCKENS